MASEHFGVEQLHILPTARASALGQTESVREHGAAFTSFGLKAYSPRQLVDQTHQTFFKPVGVLQGVKRLAFSLEFR